jgi:hypothetical protein
MLINLRPIDWPKLLFSFIRKTSPHTEKKICKLSGAIIDLEKIDFVLPHCTA